MSFEKLELNASSLAGLYGGSLVLAGGESAAKAERPVATEPEVKAAAKTISAPAETGYPYLGKNQQHVSFLVNTGGKAIVPAAHLKFLTKMLEACRLGLDDVAILNHVQQPVDQKSLRGQLLPKTVVLFGITAGEIGLPLDFPQFQVYNYDGVGYLQVPALEELNGDTEQAKLLKSKLWVCLRQLFQV